MAQAWDVIYKNLYESLTRFRELLENGRKQTTKMNYFIVVVLNLPTVKTHKSLETNHLPKYCYGN